MPKTKQTSRKVISKRNSLRETNTSPPSPGRVAARITGGTPIQRTRPQLMLRRMKNLMTRMVGTLHAKLGKLEDKINNGSIDQQQTASQATNLNSASCSTIPNPTLMEPSTSVIYYTMPQTSLSEKPKFPSRNIHPVNFIEDLNVYLKKLPPNTGNEIDLIIECLDGESRNWARIYKERWSRYDDFKRDFLDTYWGEAEQNALRRKIVNDTWDERETMLNHFISLCGQAKMLTYPIQEKQLVNDIMNHFPKEVLYAWSTSHLTSILGAADFLRKLDDVNKRNPHDLSRNVPNGPSTLFSRNRQRFRKPYLNKEQFVKATATPVTSGSCAIAVEGPPSSESHPGNDNPLN